MGDRLNPLPGEHVESEHDCESCGSSYRAVTPVCLDEFCLVRGIQNPKTLGPLCPPCRVEGLLGLGWVWEEVNPKTKRLVPPESCS